MTEDYILIDRRPPAPPEAELCLVADSDDMEPYIRPGDRVYVSCHGSLGEMEAGLFLVRGQVLCRQWCEDYSGTLHLLCANPRRQERNLSFPPERRGDCVYLGKLLLPGPLPRPVYQ